MTSSLESIPPHLINNSTKRKRRKTRRKRLSPRRPKHMRARSNKRKKFYRQHGSSYLSDLQTGGAEPEKNQKFAAYFKKVKDEDNILSALLKNKDDKEAQATEYDETLLFELITNKANLQIKSTESEGGAGAEAGQAKETGNKEGGTEDEQAEAKKKNDKLKKILDKLDNVLSDDLKTNLFIPEITIDKIGVDFNKNMMELIVLLNILREIFTDSDISIKDAGDKDILEAIKPKIKDSSEIPKPGDEDGDEVKVLYEKIKLEIDKDLAGAEGAAAAVTAAEVNATDEGDGGIKVESEEKLFRLAMAAINQNSQTVDATELQQVIKNRDTTSQDINANLLATIFTALGLSEIQISQEEFNKLEDADKAKEDAQKEADNAKAEADAKNAEAKAELDKAVAEATNKMNEECEKRKHQTKQNIMIVSKGKIDNLETKIREKVIGKNQEIIKQLEEVSKLSELLETLSKTIDKNNKEIEDMLKAEIETLNKELSSITGSGEQSLSGAEDASVEGDTPSADGSGAATGAVAVAADGAGAATGAVSTSEDGSPATAVPTSAATDGSPADVVTSAKKAKKADPAAAGSGTAEAVAASGAGAEAGQGGTQPETPAAVPATGAGT